MQDEGTAGPPAVSPGMGMGVWGGAALACWLPRPQTRSGFSVQSVHVGREGASSETRLRTRVWTWGFRCVWCVWTSPGRTSGSSRTAGERARFPASVLTADAFPPLGPLFGPSGSGLRPVSAQF